jgi:hypothetical protein
MSGGGDRERGARGGARQRLGIEINTAGLARAGIAEAPGPNNKGPGGQAGTRGGNRERQPGTEPQAATPPTSKGPSGVDTGGAGSDPASMLARANSSATRARRMRMARGGGLSNVLAGGQTLG